MRKNKIAGAIKGAGRKPKNDKSEILNVRISNNAKLLLNSIDRMNRGKIVSESIEYYFKIKKPDFGKSG